MAKITFHPVSDIHELLCNKPNPASSYKADWFKKIPSFYNTDSLYGPDHGDNLTLKHCVPFRDAMSAGYIQETWQDISFDPQEDGRVNYRFPTSPEIMSHRNVNSLPMGEEFYQIEFVIRPPWAPELPSGWSVLITQPFNRPDLPFFFPSGIIDADVFGRMTDQTSIPFYLRKDAPRLIPSGTPLYQIIPFKRESWESNFAKYDLKSQAKLLHAVRKVFWGGYKELFWQKKSYK